MVRPSTFAPSALPPAAKADAAAQVAADASSLRTKRFTPPAAGAGGASFAVVAAVLTACSLFGLLIEQHFDPTNLITVYLAGVVYVALRHEQGAALLTVLGSVVLFDLVFVAPRWSLKPTDPQYFFTFGVMLAVGLVISRLAARSRRETLDARNRTQRAQALNELALQLVQARSAEEVAQAVRLAVERALGRPATVVRDTRAGAGDEIACDAITYQPAGLVSRVPLVASHGPWGAVVALRPDGLAETAEDAHLLKAFANQASVALERTFYEKRSAEVAIEAERERLRNTLLASISHDFRTPLTTIVGSTTTLLEQGHAIDVQHRKALLLSVVSEARRLHALSSDLLDLTRMEGGAVEPHFEWCPVDELIDEITSGLAARLEGYPFTVDVDPEAVVWCDPRLLGQALTNLLDNAVRHNPPGVPIGVAVEVGGSESELVVWDQGAGVPTGQQDAVFKKFWSVGGGSENRGTGLGLAICAAVAELHGGRIRVDPLREADIPGHGTSNRGARFTLTLPQPPQAGNCFAGDE